VIHWVLPSLSLYERFCRRPSTMTRQPLSVFLARTSAILPYTVTGKKSTSREPSLFLYCRSTARRKFATGFPSCKYRSSGPFGLAMRPINMPRLTLIEYLLLSDKHHFGFLNTHTSSCVTRKFAFAPFRIPGHGTLICSRRVSP